MRKCKIKICVIAFLLVFVFSFLSVCTASAADSTVTAKEKLQSFLTDVLGIDLTKYTIIEEGGGVNYPPELGGVIKRETTGIKYNSTDSQLEVAAEFHNGYIRWLHVLPIRGSVIYREQPSTSAVAETRSILERYKTFAEKYGIGTAHVTIALSLLDKASDGSPPSEKQNFNGVSGFNPTTETSSNMVQTTSQTGVGYMYTFNGVNVPNRSIGVSFAGGSFTFHDTWGLYTVASVSVITEDEAKAMALDAAKNHEVTLMRDDNSSYVVYPDWSNPTVEIGLNMIPGEAFSTQLNSDVGAVDSGGKARNPLGLYPFWAATVYFTKPIGSISGIQVGIWGDTKGIAYVHTYGHLGGSGSTGDSSQNPEPFSMDLAVALAAAAATAMVAVALVALKKRKK